MKTREPLEPPAFYEVCGFSSDDRGLLLAAGGTSSPRAPELGLYLHEITDGSLRSLGGGGAWNRFARLAPNGRWLIWSSPGDPPAASRRPAGSGMLDLWLATVDGSLVERLTRFNDVFSTDYSGPTAAVAGGWSPDGQRLLITLAPAGGTEGPLAVLAFSRPLGR